MVQVATSATTVPLTADGYLQQLRALGAWWCLGSSAVAPHLLARYAPALPAALRDAGL